MLLPYKPALQYKVRHMEMLLETFIMILITLHKSDLDLHILY